MPKGIYKRTKEHNDAIARALTGRKLAQGHRINISRGLTVFHKNKKLTRHPKMLIRIGSWIKFKLKHWSFGLKD